jgi:HAD superfamily hydrolase (TIGR01509 family)
MPPLLTIFDCDGVLVDSEIIVCRTYVPYLAELGIEITAEEIADRYVGRSAGTMIADLRTRYGRSLPEDFQQSARRRIAAAFETEPLTIDGVDAVLAAHSGRVCVASGSAPERVRRCLELAGILRYFDPYIFSATQVANGKPAPDLFLFASGQMGFEPRNCLVIEDSIHGVTAAIAAGMRVLGFTGGSHCGPDHAGRLLAVGAEQTFQHLRELPPLL